LKSRDYAVPYAQRTSDVVVTEVGIEYGVNTYILMSPSLYGIGTDPLHEFCHTPILIRKSLLLGKTPVVGDGSGSWDNLHIVDMARAYKLVLAKILSGEGSDIPHGRDGVYFLQDGDHTWLELAQSVARAGVEIGALKTAELYHLNLEDATNILTGGKSLLAEIGWASK
jgi:nucleoside-diphosphate-sugar epimerase